MFLFGYHCVCDKNGFKIFHVVNLEFGLLKHGGCYITSTTKLIFFIIYNYLLHKKVQGKVYITSVLTPVRGPF